MVDAYICNDCGCTEWRREYSSSNTSWLDVGINSNGDVEDGDWSDSEESGDGDFTGCIQCCECGGEDLLSIDSLSNEQRVALVNIEDWEERLARVHEMLEDGKDPETARRKRPDNCSTSSKEKCAHCLLKNECIVPYE